MNTEYLERLYNPAHDLFDDEIQMNYVDRKLLDYIQELERRIDDLESKLSALGKYVTQRARTT